jgi:hypothetical protein
VEQARPAVVGEDNVKNWKAIAEASGLELPARDVDRITQPLESLEEAFRPLVRNLSPEVEPAFRLELEDSE